MPVRTRSQTTTTLALRTTPARSRPHRDGTTRAETHSSPPPAPVKKEGQPVKKTPISPVPYPNPTPLTTLASEMTAPELMKLAFIKLEKSKSNTAKFPTDRGTPLLGEIRKHTIESLTTYFTQLFHPRVRVFTPEIIDGFLEMELTDVCHTSEVFIARNILERKLKSSGFRFSQSAIALYFRVLDPCCILIGAENGYQEFSVQDAVRAMVYCLEMELFGLQSNPVYHATRKPDQHIIQTVPICFV